VNIELAHQIIADTPRMISMIFLKLYFFSFSVHVVVSVHSSDLVSSVASVFSDSLFSSVHLFCSYLESSNARIHINIGVKNNNPM
jgi:hypothetical protein